MLLMEAAWLRRLAFPACDGSCSAARTATCSRSVPGSCRFRGRGLHHASAQLRVRVTKVLPVCLNAAYSNNLKVPSSNKSGEELTPISMPVHACV